MGVQFYYGYNIIFYQFFSGMQTLCLILMVQHKIYYIICTTYYSINYYILYALVEFQSRRPPFEDTLKKDVDAVNYDPSKHNPVFYGKMHERIQSVDLDLEREFDSSLSHPSCIGHVFVNPVPPSPPKTAPALPDKNKCKSRCL